MKRVSSTDLPDVLTVVSVIIVWRLVSILFVVDKVAHLAVLIRNLTTTVLGLTIALEEETISIFSCLSVLCQFLY